MTQRVMQTNQTKARADIDPRHGDQTSPNYFLITCARLIACIIRSQLGEIIQEGRV